jgi:hypothetical protein
MESLGACGEPFLVGFTDFQMPSHILDCAMTNVRGGSGEVERSDDQFLMLEALRSFGKHSSYLGMQVAVQTARFVDLEKPSYLLGNISSH